MEDHIIYSLALNICLVGLLAYSWFLGKDGTITTAIFGMIGLNAGAILGYKLGQGNAPTT